MFVHEFNEFAIIANKWYKTLNEKILGFGIKHAKEIKFFMESAEKILDHICKERNLVIHHLKKIYI